MTRFLLRGLYRSLIALLLFVAYIYTIEGATQITATVQGQACVDTAVSRGWILPATYKPTARVTTGRVPPK